jgi:hypothetical protein
MEWVDGQTHPPFPPTKEKKKRKRKEKKVMPNTPPIET